VRLARELVSRCRSLTRTAIELDQELEQGTIQTAPALLELPGCGAVTAAKLLAEIGPVERFKSDAQLARHGGVATRASSGRVQRTDSTGRQPPAQLRPLPNRNHASPLPPAGMRVPRTQTGRGQKPPRGDLLPQTTARSHRLQHPPSEPLLDIGATLAQRAMISLAA
jgi:Transposase IS116/IS110/IS902 family